MSGENEWGVGSCGRGSAERGSGWTAGAPEVALRGEGGPGDGIPCVYLIVRC